jgi:hypothetical protein
MKLMLRELKTGPSLGEDLAYVLRIGHRHIRRMLLELKEMDLVRIAGWEKRGKHVVAIWGLKSPRPDAPRPPKMDIKIICRQYRLRKKQFHAPDFVSL